MARCAAPISSFWLRAPCASRTIAPAARMSADGCEVIQSDGDRTADGMAARWKLVRPEPATVRLEPSEPFWEVLEFTVQVERSVDSPGLGIMLGIRSSIRGRLTLVTGVVEGGNAAMATTALLPGDAIASVRRQHRRLNYDGTIDALCSLPAAPAPAVLTVKRLRKVPVVTHGHVRPTRQARQEGAILRGAESAADAAHAGRRGRPSATTICSAAHRAACSSQGQALEPMGSAERQMLAREPAWRLTCKSVVGPLEKDEEMTIRIRPDSEQGVARRGASGARGAAARLVKANNFTTYRRRASSDPAHLQLLQILQVDEELARRSIAVPPSSRSRDGVASCTSVSVRSSEYERPPRTKTMRRWPPIVPPACCGWLSDEPPPPPPFLPMPRLPSPIFTSFINPPPASAAAAARAAEAAAPGGGATYG